MATETKHIIRSSAIVRTARVALLEGQFDLPVTRVSEQTWDVALPLQDQPWHIGLIVGPSGGGKSTVAKELFGDRLVGGFDWPPDKAVVDGFPDHLSMKDISELLSSVGFSSPPAWLRPFAALSNGEQFRVTMARALAEATARVVVDEFTSVVDRQVAQIGSAAIAKTVRRRDQQFIAVTCHYDVEDWLQPDWVYEPHINRFRWRGLQRRPAIDLVITRGGREAWRLFRQHHYLTHEHSAAARVFLAWWKGQPVAFFSVLPAQGFEGYWRGHRAVCLPDFQGVGIGNTLTRTVASLVRAAIPRGRFSVITSHPGYIAAMRRSAEWTMVQSPQFTAAHATTRLRSSPKSQSTRLTASFVYSGPPFPDAALATRLWGEQFETPGRAMTASQLKAIARKR